MPDGEVIAHVLAPFGGTVVRDGTLVVPTGLPGVGAGFGMTVGPEPPGDPAIGWLWFNENTGELWIWDGLRWLSIAVARPAMWDGGEARWDLEAIWDEGAASWDDGTALWDDGEGEAIWDQGAVIGGGDGLSLDQAIALFVLKAGDAMQGPLDMSEFPINNLAPVPNPPNGAAPRYWVMQEIAATSLYQGIWNVQHNVPDLSQAALHQNDFGWIAITPTPDTAIIVPAEPVMPGLNGETVHYGDHIVWSSVEGRFDIIQSSNLSLTEAEDLFLMLDGGTMRGPLLVDRAPTTDMQVANRRWVLDQIEEGGGGDGTPFPEAPADGRGYLRIGQPPARWDAGLSLLGGIMLGPINMNGLAIVNLPDDPPATSNNAAPAYWVMQEISATTLYQGTWQALLNIPDLSRVETHHNGFSWIALTPDPTQPISTTATGIAGIPQGTEIWYGDHIVWSASYSRFDVIRSSNLSLLEAEEFFVLKAGDTMEGPLYLEELPANPSPLLAARVDWVQQRIAEVEAGGGIEIPLTIAHGGTEATNAAQARENLGITQANLGGPFLRLSGADTMGGPLDMGGYAITDLASIPEDEDWAVSKHWLDETVAAVTLYQGTWQASLNIPDLTQVSTHQNGFSWIALTPDPNQSVIVPAGILHPSEPVEVFYADHIVWSSNMQEFNVIHSGNLSVTEAEQLFLSLTGGTMKGPIYMGNFHLTGLPAPEAPSDAATMAWVENEILNAGLGGGEGPTIEFPIQVAQGGTGATTFTLNNPVANYTGHSPLIAGDGGNPLWAVTGPNGYVGTYGATAAIVRFGTGAFDPYLEFIRGRGSLASPSAPGVEDSLGGLKFGSWTGGSPLAYRYGAQIFAYPTENHSTSQLGTGLTLQVTAPGGFTEVRALNVEVPTTTLAVPQANYDNPLLVLRAQTHPAIRFAPFQPIQPFNPNNHADSWQVYGSSRWYGVEAIHPATPDDQLAWFGFSNSQPSPWFGIGGGPGVWDYGPGQRYAGYSVTFNVRGQLQVSQAPGSIDFGQRVIDLAVPNDRWCNIWYSVDGVRVFSAGQKNDGRFVISEQWPIAAERLWIDGSGNVGLSGPLDMRQGIGCGDLWSHDYTGNNGNILADGWVHGIKSLGTDGNISASGSIHAQGGISFGIGPDSTTQLRWAPGVYSTLEAVVNAPTQGIWNADRIIITGWEEVTAQSQYWPCTHFGVWTQPPGPWELNGRFVAWYGRDQWFFAFPISNPWTPSAWSLPGDALAAVNSVPELREDMVRSVMPSAVIPAHDEIPEHMWEPPLIATLWKAVQQLSARVDELERAR